MRLTYENKILQLLKHQTNHMKRTVFSLILAILAFTALPSYSLAAKAPTDSADQALEKALSDLRDGNSNDTQDETTVEEVTFNDNNTTSTMSPEDIKSEILDNLSDIDADDTEIAAVLFLLGVFFMPFIALVAIIWVICAYRANERRQRYALVSKAIDNNYPLPPTVFERNMRSPLRSSSYLLALGLCVIIFFICVDAWKVGVAIGCVPILIGAAKLTAYRLEKEDRQ